jgi:glycosyltransferase involved in cell wall biosynthesis
VFLLPSLIEGLPGVILEAFATRLPVVSYNVGGIKEVVLDKETGFLIDKNNEIDFLKAINNCLSSDNDLIKNNAYELVSKNYSNEAIAYKFLEFYKKYLNI